MDLRGRPMLWTGPAAVKSSAALVALRRALADGTHLG